MTLFERILRRLVTRGQLTIFTPDGAHFTVGKADPAFPDLALRLQDKRVAFDIVRDPRLGMAEAYIDGRVTIEGGGILEFLSMIRANNPWESGRSIDAKNVLARGLGTVRQKLWRANHKARAKANVAHHYDLSAALYALFLDRDRQYSCAYWPDADNEAGISLDQAQEDKKAHIAAKLLLKPGMRVLDIGCGWGGMALYLHRTCGVDVTGITLSEEQLKIARQRAADAGVSDHVRFELIDYRDMTGPFDRIVSVGMLEHVGPADVPAYFRTVRRLLAPGGVAVIHSIAVHDRAAPVNRWMTRYIFPGGHLPSLPQLVRAAEAGGLKILDMEIMRGHYAETLLHWRMRFLRNRDRITALYDERFVRMWEFYLAGCEYFFRCQHGMVVQLQLSDDHQAVPESRDYITELETEFRDRLCRNDHSGKKRASAT